MIRPLAVSPKNPGSIPGTRQELQLHSEGSRPILDVAQPLTQWVPCAHFAGVKRLRSEAEHLDPPSAEVKNLWGYTSILPYFFMESTGTTLTVQCLWNRTHLEKLVKNCLPVCSADRVSSLIGIVRKKVDASTSNKRTILAASVFYKSRNPYIFTVIVLNSFSWRCQYFFKHFALKCLWLFLFDYECNCNMLYLQHVVSAVRCICSILYLQHVVSAAFCICSLFYLQHFVSAEYCICSILYLQHVVSAARCICSMLYLQHVISAAYCIYSTLYLQHVVSAARCICSILFLQHIVSEACCICSMLYLQHIVSAARCICSTLYL